VLPDDFNAAGKMVTPETGSLLKREADIAIGLWRPEHMRVVSRRLTDYRLYVYDSLAYLEKAAPIVAVQKFEHKPFSLPRTGGTPGRQS
jgi:hypothetical protein